MKFLGSMTRRTKTLTPKKNTSGRKRTPFPREVHYTTRFSKDWEKLDHSGKHDMHLIKEAILLLMMNDEPMPAEWRDHKLNGAFEGMRERHVKGDLLLFYKLEQKSYCEAVIFSSITTHSEAF